jgi:glycosyltransferase involved in cell wall biosynthesis
VVTPVYNTEKYLAECIESVLAQTYQNWEYIIVDNCSTDRSAEIAQRYAQQDSRIRIHRNQQFLSVIPNWNNALLQISNSSKYCKVVHADDWMFPECLERMVAVAEQNPSVGIVGSYRLEENDVTLDGLPYPSMVVNGRDLARSTLLGGAYVFGSPTSILVRSDIVRARPNFYNESNLHADSEICFDLLQDHDFGFVHQVLTYTRRHNEATTSFARRMRTFLPGELTSLVKYGPRLLAREEYERHLRRRLNNYYRYLGKSWLSRREKQFWEYHRGELQKIGLPLSRARLLRGAISVVLSNLLDPAESFRKLAAHLHPPAVEAPKTPAAPAAVVPASRTARQPNP